jgi:hypothetical protein
MLRITQVLSSYGEMFHGSVMVAGRKRFHKGGEKVGYI